MVMEQHSDFNIAHFTFWHNPESSLRIWELTKGGQMLFPFDPMAEKVRVMKKYKIYSLNGLKKAYELNKEFADTLKMLDSGWRILDVRLSIIAIAYTKDEIHYITSLYHEMYPGSFNEGDIQG